MNHHKQSPFFRSTAVLLLIALTVSCAGPRATSSSALGRSQLAAGVSEAQGLDNPALRFKYRMDRVLSGGFLVLLSPLFLTIIAAIEIEGVLDPDARGPVFWRETRISRGKPFRIFKFRVLKASAMKRVQPGESVWPYQQDRKKNVTLVGRVLLQVYLDELPQLINVFRGEMSLVGPRPRTPFIYEKDLAKGFIALEYLKGGITGPHQLFKGSVFQSPARSNDYYEKCKTYGTFQLFGYDLGIMWQTFFKILKAEGL